MSLFLEPADLFPEPVRREVAPEVHHPQAEPLDHLCTCGKVREVCVHDEVRALWSGSA